MSKLNIENISNRIRYESISKLATELGKTADLSSFEKTLKANAKFIVSSYRYLMCFFVNEEAHLFSFRCESMNHEYDFKSMFSNISVRPLIAHSKKPIQEDSVADALLRIEDSHSLLRVVSKEVHSSYIFYFVSSEPEEYNISDIKFLKLMGDISYPRIQSLVLAKKISAKNSSLLLFNTKLKAVNHELLSSIQYAQMIQKALLPSALTVLKIFPDNFILFSPRDKVSGDFYFAYENEEYKIIVAADCTGHGVPGAILSIFGIQILREICTNNKQLLPDNILRLLDQKFEEYLLMGITREEKLLIKDGMDLSIVSINKKENVLHFSAAFRPLLFFNHQEQKFLTYKGSRYSIGNYTRKHQKEFELESIHFSEKDRFFIFSDGYVDQFGGPRDKKLQTKRLIHFLEESNHLSIEDQGNHLENSFLNWKAEREQIDDVLLIGVEL